MTAQPSVSRAPSPLFSHLIPSFTLAVLATILFWWNPFGHPNASPEFHLLMKSNVKGLALLLADVDGTGLHKGHLNGQPVEGGDRLNHVKFQIPPGRLCGFILTALDRPAEVELQKCWITTGHGDVVAILPPASMLSHAKDVQPGSVEGSVRFRTDKGGTIQGFQYSPKLPIDIAVEPPPPL